MSRPHAYHSAASSPSSTETSEENTLEPWIQTFSGKYFYLLRPEDSEFDIEDIAHGLANTCRYNGQCLKFYSVAQHSVLMADWLLTTCPKSPEFAFIALLHDASEAYMPDIPSPLKQLLRIAQLLTDKCDVPRTSYITYAQAESQILDAIFTQLSPFKPDPIALELVQTTDKRIRVNEAKILMDFLSPMDWSDNGRYIPLSLSKDAIHCLHNPWSPEIAKISFLNLYEGLLNKFTKTH